MDNTQRLEELLLAEDTTRSMLASPDSPNADLLAASLEQIGTEIVYLLGVSGVASELEEKLRLFEQGEDEIAHLGNLASLGIIDKSALEEREQTHLELPNKDRVLRFALDLRQISGAQAEYPPTTHQPLEVENDAGQEEEKNPQKITITVGDSILSINDTDTEQPDKGEKVTLKTPGKTDYSQEKLAMITALVTNKGKWLIIRDLWRVIGNGDESNKPAKPATLLSLRRWMDSKLTYGGRHIVKHNGKRGVSSAYGIMDFDPIIEFEDLGGVQGAETQPQNVASTPTVDTEHPPSQEEATEDTVEQGGIPFPLNDAQCCIIASLLAHNNDLLERAGYDQFDKAIVDRSDNDEDLANQIDALKKSNDVFQIRLNAISILKEFLNNEELVLETIETMPQDDRRFPLFEYLTKYDVDIVINLLIGMVNRVKGIEYTVNTGRRAGWGITGVRIVEVNGDGPQSNTDMSNSLETVSDELSIRTNWSL